MAGSSTIEYYHRSRLLRRIPVTEDFFRISSSPDAAVLVPGLENYAVTIDARNSPYRVKSRSDRLVTIDGKALVRDVWTEWPSAVELAIEPGLSFKVRLDVPGDAGAEAASVAGTAASPMDGSARGAAPRAADGLASSAASDGTESRTAVAKAGATVSEERLKPWLIGVFAFISFALVGLSWGGGIEKQASKQSEEHLERLLTALVREINQPEGQGGLAKDGGRSEDEGRSEDGTLSEDGRLAADGGLSENAIRFRFALNQLRYARYLEQQDRLEEKKAAYKLLWDRCALEHAEEGIDLNMRRFVESRK